MSDTLFDRYHPTEPVKNYDDDTQVIRQGLDPKILDRMDKAERGELKAKLSAILDRGIVQDRLHVDLPDDLHGEWVRNDPLEIRRLEALGFQIDNEYAVKRAIHTDGTNSAIVGDVVHMTCPKEVKETIDEIRKDRMIREHSGKRVGKKKINKEERDLLADVDRLRSAGVSAFVNSTDRPAGNRELADIVESMDSQTKKFE